MLTKGCVYGSLLAVLLAGVIHAEEHGSAVTPPPAEASADVPAASGDSFGNDGIDRNASDFVHVSLLVMSPGKSLYSCAGHACLRMECPSEGLDYCFSYEGEPVSQKIPTYLAGNLKMGMLAVPTETYLGLYRAEGRGVAQYRLDIPPEARPRLWKLLDDKVAEGADLPYDYVKRGCATSVPRTLLESLGDIPFTEARWPAKYARTLREIVDDAIGRTNPWTTLFLHTITGTDVDRDVPEREKIVLPGDLVEYLEGMRIDGKPVIAAAPDVLVPTTSPTPAGPFITPMLTGWIAVAIAVAGFFLTGSWLDKLFLSAQTALGVFLVYVFFLSNLPSTGWSWLLIPFNPLPLVFWKWRRYWAPGFAVVLVLWELVMVFSGHRLTDAAYPVLVLAVLVFCLKQCKCQRNPESKS